MDLFVYVALFVFGTIIGSFLNVVLYRLHTGRSLGGRSHCMSCGKMLNWHELVPLFSYALQGGRCRGCSAYIPSRYFFVELYSGLKFVLLWMLFSHDPWLFSLNVVFLSLLTLILVYDVRHTIIPDELTILVGINVFVILGYMLWGGELFHTIALHVVAGLVAGAFFFLLWAVSKGRWIGLGDAKLAVPLGMLVGLEGVFGMVVLSFWIGAIVSLVLLGTAHILKKWKTNLRFSFAPRTMKSEVPFAPFLILGFLLIYIVHADIFDITHTLFLSWW